MVKKLATYSEDLQLDESTLSQWSEDNCYLVALSDWQISVILSCLRYAEWSARWVNVSDWPTLYNKIQDLEGCLLMGCNVSELNEKVERIAVALESINDKVIERYTYEEFIADIEDAFGIGSILAQIVAGIFGLMPRLRLKADFTPLLISIVETWTRWRPLHNGIKDISTELSAIASALVPSKVLAWITSLTDLLDVVGNGWKDLVMGDNNIWDAIIKPLWANLISDEDGGDGGEDPDADEDLRVLTRVTNNITNAVDVDVDVNACCYNPVDNPGTETEVTGQTDVNTPPDWWEGTPSEYNAYKCERANFLYDQYREYLNRVLFFIGLTGSPAQLFGAWLALSGDLVFGSLMVAGAIVTLFWYVVTVAIAGLITGALLTAWASALEGDKETIICDLYNALDEDEARLAIIAWLEDNAPVGLPSDWIAKHVDALFPNNVLAILWQDTGYYELPEDYVPEIDCATTCGVTWGAFTLVNGTLTAGSLDAGTTGFQIQSVYLSSGLGPCNRHQIYFLTPTNTCVSITHNTTNQVDKVCSDNVCFFYYGCGDTDYTYSTTYTGGTVCVEPNTYVLIRSQPDSQFTLTVTVNGVCP